MRPQSSTRQRNPTDGASRATAEPSGRFYAGVFDEWVKRDIILAERPRLELFFHHVDEPTRAMVALLEANRASAEIMRIKRGI